MAKKPKTTTVRLTEIDRDLGVKEAIEILDARLNQILLCLNNFNVKLSQIESQITIGPPVEKKPAIWRPN